MSTVKSIKMVCEVCPEGQKLTAARIEYDTPVGRENALENSFEAEGRNVTGAHICPKDSCTVVVDLSKDDPDAALTYFENPGPSEKWMRRPAALKIRQTADLRAEDGTVLPAWETGKDAEGEIEPLVEKFTQHVFYSDRTGRDLPYNLFLPEGYSEQTQYPLVMFIHDKGPLDDNVKTTLRQGIGAVIWASDEVQKDHPCIVLAPQFSKVPSGDGEPDMLETTFDLYEYIVDQYSVDKKRLYTTGQSMGCMSSIAMGIRRPDFFTAFLLVAGQWDAEAMKVLHDAKMFIIVSRGDPRAFAGMNESLVKLDDEGAEIRFAAVDQDGGVVPEEQIGELLSKEANIYYAVLKTRKREFSCHMGTWQVAYGIRGAREWLFAQSKE